MDAMNAMPPDDYTKSAPEAGASDHVGETSTIQQSLKPTRLSEVDRLTLENISLKLLNLGHQFEKLTAARAGFSRQFDELRKACIERYGIDIATTRIDEEGNFQRAEQMPFQGRIVDPGMKVQV